MEDFHDFVLDIRTDDRCLYCGRLWSDYLHLGERPEDEDGFDFDHEQDVSGYDHEAMMESRNILDLDPEDISFTIGAARCERCGAPATHLARTKDWSTAMYPVCVRCYIELDPISNHHPDCQCTRCTVGDLEFIRMFYPEEY